jgi:glucose/arabinose dehydrogenase
MRKMKNYFLLIVGIILTVYITSSYATGFAQEYPELGVRVEVVAENLSVPWSIDWTPDGTILFTERNGHLRIIQDGNLVSEPLLSLGVGGVEGGMLGIAVDPNYSENNFVYLYFTQNEFLSTSNNLVRYELVDGMLTENKVLIEGIPGGPFHDGGRIQFGPDGKLYVTTGDAGNSSLSQDLGSLGGKILRINSDGTIPDDNPWKLSPIYSFGHRNPQGLDWDDAGNLVATEHGPSGLRGIGHDEINLIVPGANYGWPDIIGDEEMDDMKGPILHTGDDAWAPSGSEFYDGDKISQWTGKYFVATLRGSHLHMIEFESENISVVSHEKLFQDEFGRIRDVQTGPEGFLYLLTSNQDGRGSPKTNDDKILRIVPIDSPAVVLPAQNSLSENSLDSENFADAWYVYAGLIFVAIVTLIFLAKKWKKRQ